MVVAMGEIFIFVLIFDVRADFYGKSTPKS